MVRVCPPPILKLAVPSFSRRSAAALTRTRAAVSSRTVPRQPSVSVSGQRRAIRTRPLLARVRARLETTILGPVRSADDVVPPVAPAPPPGPAPGGWVVNVWSAPRPVPAALVATSR